MVLCTMSNTWARCPIDPSHISSLQPIDAPTVLDGDTIRFKTGGKLRLVGINTPEKASNWGGQYKEAEPGAAMATNKLKQWSDLYDLYWLAGQKSMDHHNRYLGHLYAWDKDSNSYINLNAKLVSSGLAFAVSHADNLLYADCYQLAEASAQRAQKGLWHMPYWQFKQLPKDTPSLKSGFSNIQANVKSVYLSKKNIWVTLYGDVTLKLAAKHMSELKGDTLDKLVHFYRQQKQGLSPKLELSAQGWLVDRMTFGKKYQKMINSGQRTRWQMSVQTAYDLKGI